MNQKHLLLASLASLLLSTHTAFGDDDEEKSKEARKSARESRNGDALRRQLQREQSNGNSPKNVQDEDDKKSKEERQAPGQRKKESKDEKGAPSRQPDRDAFRIGIEKSRRRDDDDKDSREQKRDGKTVPVMPDRAKDSRPQREIKDQDRDRVEDFFRRERDRDDERRRDDDRARGDMGPEVRLTRERYRHREERLRERARDYRDRFSDYRRHKHIFDDHFWNSFRRRYDNWRFDTRFSWSAEVSWPRVVVWLPWKWSRPIYYYYDSSGYVYTSETPGYNYLVPVGSMERFIAEAERIANSGRALSTDRSDWMPLGMFALADDSGRTDMATEYISLAISKGGAVSGAYFNVQNNEMLEIQGAIDPKSQRVAWKFADRDWPIMESGLYNLTMEESYLLVHISKRRTETREIIRLN